MNGALVDPLLETAAQRARRVMARRGLRGLHDATPRTAALLGVFVIPPTERIL